MKEDLRYILIFDKTDKSASMQAVIRLSKTKFRVAENSIKDRTLNIGTEFETRINEFGQYEITEITKPSNFITRRFYIADQEDEIDFNALEEEINRQGGHWQVDDIDIVSISLPKKNAHNLEGIFRSFKCHPNEF